jgi:hypothetical protein
MSNTSRVHQNGELEHAAEAFRLAMRKATMFGLVLLVNVAAIVPFLAGFP